MIAAPGTSAQWTWALVVMGTLRDAGITRVVSSPGSRSTPLLLAAQKVGLDLFPVIDERVAAFLALGWARTRGVPAALLCTSGSAGAHYYPALIEAACARAPVIAVTADRPPEHHGAGASQTIDQTRLYGAFARASIDLGRASADAAALAGARRRLAQAVALARGPAPGPVHINVPLAKPLEPPADADVCRDAEQAAAAVRANPIAAACRGRAVAENSAIEQVADACARARRGVIVAGPAPLGAAGGLFALAARTGFPILTEATSQLRFCEAPADALRVTGFDWFLAAPKMRAALAPDLVVCAGAEPASTSVLAYLAENLAAPRIVLAGDRWIDSQNAADLIVFGDIDDVAGRTAARIESPVVDPAWRAAFAEADARAWHAFEDALAAEPAMSEAGPAMSEAGPAMSEAGPAMSEAAAVRVAVSALPDDALLCVGNSLPVRMVDRACRHRGPRDVICQRGASGIDGLISGAAGAALATGRPTMLLIGDVSFCHDLGGLLAARAVRAPLAVVVIDNGGGRIFDELPVARLGLDSELAKNWLTPPATDLAALAKSVGVAAALAPTADALRAQVQAALAEPTTRVIHAVVAPNSAARLRKTMIEMLDVGADTLTAGANGAS